METTTKMTRSKHQIKDPNRRQHKNPEGTHVEQPEIALSEGDRTLIAATPQQPTCSNALMIDSWLVCLKR
jgi:hypothetical protein